MLAVDYDRLGVQQRLTRLGASAVEDAYGVQGVFPAHAAVLSNGEGQPRSETRSSATSAGEIFPLSDLGVIQVSGADAVKFLHAQLTNDLEKLQDSQWRWYGYCNAKGRMQLSAAGYKRGETIALIASRPLCSPLAKRLGMFVMRAKAKVVDASVQYEVYGLQGDIAPLLSRLGVNLEAPQSASSISMTLGEEKLELLALETFSRPSEIGQPPHIVARYLVVAPSGSGFWQAALASGLQARDSAGWRLSEVATASARIVPATYELFVPQMLNFESLGGVDFKKGCYPGQEVVARSQYLGKLKRRMFVAHLVSASPPKNASGFEPAPAQDVWASDAVEPQEPCGQVVLAAALPGQPVQVLFEAQTGAVEQGKIGLRDSSGQWHSLVVRSLPYPLLEI